MKSIGSQLFCRSLEYGRKQGCKQSSQITGLQARYSKDKIIEKKGLVRSNTRRNIADDTKLNEKNRKSIILPYAGIWSQTRMQAKLANNRSASKVQQGQNN